MTNGDEDGEGRTVCSRTDVTSLRVSVVWVLIWSVEGIRVYRKTEHRDDVPPPPSPPPSCLHLLRGKNTINLRGSGGTE